MLVPVSSPLLWCSAPRAFLPLLLPSGTDDNGPGFCDGDANLFLLVIDHKIVVGDSAVGCSTHYRAGAVRTHGIGARQGYSLSDHAVHAQGLNTGNIAVPVGGEYTDNGKRADPDESPLAGGPIVLLCQS